MTFTERRLLVGVLVLLGLLTVSGCPGVIVPGDDVLCELLPAVIDNDLVLLPGCYRTEQSVTVSDGALLTIMPGVTIYFAADTGLTVLSDGRLVAEGTAAAPIKLTGNLAVRGYWRGLHFSSSGSADNRLDYVTIEYGGGYDFFGWETARANLVLSGTVSSPTRISVTNCTLRESAGAGFFTDESVEVDEFGGNTITANATAAGVTSAAVLDFLDDTSTYQGNVLDVIYVSGDDIDSARTWPALDAAYVFTTGTTVHAALTIAPGATLKFQEGVGFTVLTDGSLTAVGTAEQPILFTGEAEVPGHWNGLYFSSSNSYSNRLEHVTVEYGGGYEFFGWDTARTNLVLNGSVLEVNNCTFQHSAGWGIWVSSDSTLAGDLETSSFFENVAGEVFWE